MRSAANVAWVAGPLVVLSYLAAAGLAAATRRDGRPAAVAEAGLALGAVTVGWHVAKRVAPGPHLSPVAFESVQVLLSWQSVALWCGAAVVLGAVAPVSADFRGSSGLAAALAIVAVHSPTTALAALAGFAAGLVAFRGRAHDAVAVGLVAVPAYEWVAGAADLQGPWGVVHGPELTLWSVVLTTILLAAWWRGHGSIAQPLE